MLMDAKIVDGEILVIWDEHDREVIRLPLLALQNFNPGICATEILSTLLQTTNYQVIPVEELAKMAANAAKIIRDILTDGQDETT